MLRLHLDYASPSAYHADRARATLGLSADHDRRVHFKGKVKSEHVFLFRTALRALGEVVWSNDNWYADGYYDILDPIITVHPDKVFFEVFSQDQSVHALATFDRTLFETEGEVVCGSANVDFTAWLWNALGEMRSRRATWLQIDNAGFEVSTVGAGGRFEKKVEVPYSWVRAFLEVQSAATLPGTRLQVRPVDLLSVIRFLRYSKPKTSPRAIRYEFDPGEPVRVVLEPWEERFTLAGCHHNYGQRKVTRLWGRRRLRLLEALLPFTDSVEVFLKGRALPSFYHLQLPGIEFTLGLSGWSRRSLSSEDGFHLTRPTTAPDNSRLQKGRDLLQQRFSLTVSELAQAQTLSSSEAESLLTELCRNGEAFYQPDKQVFRSRQLFRNRPEPAKLYPPNPRMEKACQLAESSQVEVTQCEPRETTRVKRLDSPRGKVLREIVYRDWHYEGRVADFETVEVVVNDRDRIIFGKCGCPYFEANLLNQGPCEHMLALRLVAEKQRTDLPTSSPFREDQD